MSALRRPLWWGPVNRMDQVFKAYDVRGTVPDQLDADMCRAIGRAMARFAGAPEILVARDMRRVGDRAVGGVLRRRAGRGRRRHRPGHGLHRLPVLRVGPPRRARRHVHGLAQPGAVQRHEALPVGGEADRARHRAGGHPGRGREAARRAAAAAARRPPGAGPARRVGRARGLLRRRAPRCARSRSWPTRPTAWAGWSCRSSSRSCPSSSRSCSPSSTAASPTTRPTRSSRRTWST